ncbi:MAG: MFS transporter [Alphaproteobacteria bacterium]|nr:MFS transporter [Alphaproteobacteria bacterium]
MEGFRLLRAYPAFARFWLAEAISLIGDWFSLVAVSVLAITEGTGAGAWSVAVTLAAYEVPMALVRPWAGVLADRFDRRNLLVGIHLGQAALTGLMALLAARGELQALQLVVVVRSLMSGLDWPARAGATRRLVPPEDLLAASAFGGATWSAMYAIGMSLGGFVASYGAAFALAVDTSTFVAAAALLGTLPAMPTRAEGSLLRAARRSLADLREAAVLAWRAPDLLGAVTAKTPFGLAGGAAVVMLNVVSDQTAFLGTGAATLGVLQAVRGAGTGLGPLVAERLVRGGVSLGRVYGLVALAGFTGIACFGWVRTAPLVVAAVFLWGAGTGANWMLSAAEVQRRAPDEAVGRLSGLDMLLVETSFGLSALVGGAVIERWRVGAAAAAAVGMGIAAMVVLRWWIPALQRRTG